MSGIDIMFLAINVQQNILLNPGETVYRNLMSKKVQKNYNENRNKRTYCILFGKYNRSAIHNNFISG